MEITPKKRDIIISAVILGLLIVPSFYIFIPIGDDSSPEKIIKIPNGTGLYQIGRILKDEKLIRSRLLFIAYVMAAGDRNSLKSGEYKLSQGMNVPQIAERLRMGLAESNDVEVLVPEGVNVWEIDKILVDKKLISVGEFSTLAYKEEGNLFPDTYRFDPEVKTEDIIAKLKGNFDDKAGSVNGRTLIIASMLEKEVKTEEDMRIVAGIIEKRMEIGMLLQIDATVAYGVCLREFNLNRKNCDVTQVNLVKEIKIDSPYNSYIRKGLPAGPISNPGLKAIRAAQNPKPSDYLFYLSAKDGTTIFSKTSSEHAQNRRKYLGL